jgi:hypothetical protein
VPTLDPAARLAHLQSAFKICSDELEPGARVLDVLAAEIRDIARAAGFTSRTCRECGRLFFLTAKELRDHEQRGRAHRGGEWALPERCVLCRRATRQERAELAQRPPM